MKRSIFPTNNGKKDNEDKNKQEQREKQVRAWISYLLVNLVLVWLFQEFIMGPLIIRETQIPYSEFKNRVREGRVQEVVVAEDHVRFVLKGSGDQRTRTFTTVPIEDPKLLEDLEREMAKVARR